MISFFFLLNESPHFSSLFLKKNNFFCNLTLQNLLSYYPNMVMQWYIWWRSLTTLHLGLAAIFQMHTRLMYPNFLNHHLILFLYHKFHPFNDFKWILRFSCTQLVFIFFFFFWLLAVEQLLSPPKKRMGGSFHGDGIKSAQMWTTLVSHCICNFQHVFHVEVLKL